jgi:hypothetical protein
MKGARSKSSFDVSIYLVATTSALSYIHSFPLSRAFCGTKLLHRSSIYYSFLSVLLLLSIPNVLLSSSILQTLISILLFTSLNRSDDIIFACGGPLWSWEFRVGLNIQPGTTSCHTVSRQVTQSHHRHVSDFLQSSLRICRPG